MLVRVLWSSLGLLLTGCASAHVMSHVPISTMARLASLSVADINPTELRAAARLPDDLEPQPGGVKVTLKVASGGGRPAINTVFVLVPALAANELAPLATYIRPGQKLWVYRLSESDTEQLSKIISEKRAGQTGMTLAVGVDACHRRPFGSAALPTTTFLRTSAAGYLVLMQDLDLRTLGNWQEIAAKVPACG